MATADLNFFPLYGPLGRDYRVIAPDLRGHGRGLLSEGGFSIEAAADDVAGLLTAIGVASAIVVGYSLGTSVAQTLALRHPHLASALVLAAGEFRPRRQIHKKLALRGGGWHGTWQRLTRGRWLGHRMVDKAVATNPGAEEIRGWIVAELERGHTASLRDAGRALGRFDSATVAEHCDVPVVVVKTLKDHLVKPRLQQGLAELWDAPIVPLEADHDAPVAHPDLFVAAILEAVAQAKALVVSSGTDRMQVPIAG
jgi:3-oxoadipate enol-lactonase